MADMNDGLKDRDLKDGEWRVLVILCQLCSCNPSKVGPSQAPAPPEVLRSWGEVKRISAKAREVKRQTLTISVTRWQWKAGCSHQQNKLDLRKWNHEMQHFYNNFHGEIQENDEIINSGLSESFFRGRKERQDRRKTIWGIWSNWPKIVRGKKSRDIN